MTNSLQKATSVAVVNKQQIIIVSKDGVDYVPIRPICDALGVNFSGQHQRINRDEIFNSVVCTVHTTAADGKQYEMLALPHEFIFGWLFTIDTNLVKKEVRDAVIGFKRECNHVLYNYFKSYADYVNHRAMLIEQAASIKDAIRHEFNTAKERLKEADEAFRVAIKFNYADWVEANAQLKIDFAADAKGGEE